MILWFQGEQKLDSISTEVNNSIYRHVEGKAWFIDILKPEQNGCHFVEDSYSDKMLF